MKRTFWVARYDIDDVYQKNTDRQIRVELNRRHLSIIEEKNQSSEVWYLDTLLHITPQPPDGISYLYRLIKGPDTAHVEINFLSRRTRKKAHYSAEVNFWNRQYDLIDHPVTFLAPPPPTSKVLWVQKYAVSSVDWPSMERGDSMPGYLCSRPEVPMYVTLRKDEMTIGVNSVNKETWHLDTLVDVTYRRIKEGIKETREWRATKENESSHQSAIIYVVTMDDDKLGYDVRLHVFTDIKSHDKWTETLYLLKNTIAPEQPNPWSR